MNILIYDDNDDDVNHLLECINTFFTKSHQHYSTYICKNSTELFQLIKNYDLLFLDIKLNDENGIDIGLKLQSQNHDCRIIITTNYSKYAIDGYKINADRYFIKPISQKEFDIEMDTIIKKYIRKSIGFFDSKISNYKVYINNIMYIEFTNRKSVIHYLNGNTIESSCTLKYLYDKLKDYGFGYPYKAFLVNFEYISALKKNEIILINDEAIPLSRHYKKEFENKYYYFLHEML